MGLAQFVPSPNARELPALYYNVFALAAITHRRVIRPKITTLVGAGVFLKKKKKLINAEFRED